MALNKKIAILFNPSAGKGIALNRKKLLESVLETVAVSYEMILSESETHLRQMVAPLAHDHVALVVAGGDSSLYIVINEMMRLGITVPLGFIPLGSCNDLAREFALHPLKKACLAIQRMRPRPIDIGCLSSQGKALAYFPGQASIGLGVEVNRMMDKTRSKRETRKKNQMWRGIGAIRQALTSSALPLNLQVESDDEIVSGDFLLGIFSNIRYYASGMKVFADARPDDGRLDALLLPPLSFSRLIALGLGALADRLDTRRVRILQSRQFRVVSATPFQIQVDGNILGESQIPSSFTDVSIRTCPSAILLLT